MIYEESVALVRIAENCNAIQALYKEIRELSDYHDIAVELQIPKEDGFYPETVDADYNNEQWSSSSQYC
jgi:hypothetical protein